MICNVLCRVPNTRGTPSKQKLDSLKEPNSITGLKTFQGTVSYLSNVLPYLKNPLHSVKPKIDQVEIIDVKLTDKFSQDYKPFMGERFLVMLDRGSIQNNRRSRRKYETNPQEMPNKRKQRVIEPTYSSC